MVVAKLKQNLVPLFVRVSPELAKRIRETAARTGKSLGALVEECIDPQLLANRKNSDERLERIEDRVTVLEAQVKRPQKESISKQDVERMIATAIDQLKRSY